MTTWQLSALSTAERELIARGLLNAGDDGLVELRSRAELVIANELTRLCIVDVGYGPTNTSFLWLTEDGLAWLLALPEASINIRAALHLPTETDK